MMHSCSLQLAALVSSASVLCDRLDELDAGDLRLELRAVRVALSGQRVEAMARFVDNSALETNVRVVLRRILKQLEAKPEVASAAEKWAFEQLRRKARPWWSEG